MKFWNAVILLISSIVLTSCFNTTDELWIESDGSGRFETTTDLSAVYPFLMMGMEQEMDKVTEEGETVEAENDAKKMIENLFMSDNVDTTFNFQELISSSIAKEGKTMDDFWNELEQNVDKEGDLPEAQKESLMAMFDKMFHMKFRMQASKTNQLLKTTLKQSFTNVTELSSMGDDFAELIPYLDTEKTDKLSPDQLAGMDQLFNSFAKIDIKGNTLRIRRSGLDLSALGEEAAQATPMLGMFLGTAPYRLVVHLPGKVKKTSPGVEVINKTTVAVEMPLNDLFDPEKSVDYEIQFKGLK